MHRLAFALLALPLAACSSNDASPPTSQPDASTQDSSIDATGTNDATDAARDTSQPDTSAPDANPGDVDAADAASDAPIVDSAIAAPDAAPIDLVVGDAGVASFDLVSPDRCEHEFGRLFKCVIPPITIDDPNAADAGAPRKATLTTVSTGDCSSQYPLVLGVSGTDLPQVLYHVWDPPTDVRRKDDGPIPSLSFVDKGTWTSTASYADTCRLSVQVAMNLPDP